MAAGLNVAEVSQRVRIALVAGGVILLAAAGFMAYRFLTRPITLTVAAGSIDGEATNLLSTIAVRLASTQSPVRLKVIDKGTALDAAKAFSASETDLAIVRSDVGNLSLARTVVLLSYGVVMIVVPPGQRIQGIADLKGKTVGVVGGETNHAVVAALTREYGLDHAKVQFQDIAWPEIQQVLETRKLGALLVVLPITEKYLAVVRGLSGRGQSKSGVKLIAIESADAIAAVAQSYESYDLPKGTLRGSPPIPDDDLTTLRVPFCRNIGASIES